MANKTITDVDTKQVALGNNEFEHDVPFNGADVLAEGTILAIDTSTNKWVVYAKGGSTNGNGIPGGVLTYAKTTVGGDNAIAVLVKGDVNLSTLVIDADGDGANIDAVVRNLLRAASIIPIDLTQLALDDNPQQVDS